MDFVADPELARWFIEKDREMLEAGETRMSEETLTLADGSVEGLFWGCVGFDECKEERNWTEDEFAILKAFCNSIAEAIERSKIEQKLARAKETAESANQTKSLIRPSTAARILPFLRLRFPPPGIRPLLGRCV